MRALITGAGGFCGGHLTAYLADQGVETHTLGTGASPRAAHHQVRDVTDLRELTAAVRSAAPDYVFHLAGVTRSDDPTRFFTINAAYAAGLLHALEAAGHGDCPVLLVGTSAEYGIVSPTEVPIVEEQPPRPHDHYSISKLAQSLLGLAAAKHGRPIVVVRPFNIIGPRMPDHLVVGTLARQLARIVLREAPPVVSVGRLDSSRDFVDVADVVRVYWDLVRTPAAYGRIVNVCSGRGTRIATVLETLAAQAGVAIDVRVDPARLRPLDVPVHYGSVERLSSLLGYAPSQALDASVRHILDDLVQECRRPSAS